MTMPPIPVDEVTNHATDHLKGHSMNQSNRKSLSCMILVVITLTTVGCSPQHGASFEARLLTKNAGGELEEVAMSSHSHFAVNGKGSFDFTDSMLGWEVKAMESDKVMVAVTLRVSREMSEGHTRIRHNSVTCSYSKAATIIQFHVLRQEEFVGVQTEL